MSLSCLTFPPLPQFSNTCCKEKTAKAALPASFDQKPYRAESFSPTFLVLGRAQLWSLQSVLRPVPSALGTFKVLIVVGEITLNLIEVGTALAKMAHQVALWAEVSSRLREGSALSPEGSGSHPGFLLDSKPSREQLGSCTACFQYCPKASAQNSQLPLPTD